MLKADRQRKRIGRICECVARRVSKCPLERESCSSILFASGIAIDREDPKCPPDPERYLTEEGVEKTKQVAKGERRSG